MFIASKSKNWERIGTTNLEFLTCWKSMEASSGLWRGHEVLKKLTCWERRRSQACAQAATFSWLIQS